MDPKNKTKVNANKDLHLKRKRSTKLKKKKNIKGTKKTTCNKNIYMGRYAADMRIQMGGYGRPNVSINTNHLWSKKYRNHDITNNNIEENFQENSQDTFQENKEGNERMKGNSRASLKRKKKKGLGLKNNSQLLNNNSIKEVTEINNDNLINNELNNASQNLHIRNSEEKDRLYVDDFFFIKKNVQYPLESTNSLEKNSQINTECICVEEKMKKEIIMDMTDTTQFHTNQTVESDKCIKKTLVKKEKLTNEKVIKNKKKNDRENVKFQFEDMNIKKQITYAERQEKSKIYDYLFSINKSNATETIETESGLKFFDIKIGVGDIPKDNEFITVKYKCFLTGFNGPIVNKGMLSIYVFKTKNKHTGNDLIQGWEEGVGTMRPGGIRHLIVPPELGYHNKKNTKIPQNSTLYFIVHLVRIGKRIREIENNDNNTSNNQTNEYKKFPLPKDFAKKK